MLALRLRESKAVKEKAVGKLERRSSERYQISTQLLQMS